MLSRIAALLFAAAFVLGTAAGQQPSDTAAATTTSAACDYTRQTCVIEGWMF